MKHLKTKMALAFLLGSFLFVSSCKKHDSDDNNNNPGGGNNSTLADRLKDTALLYSRDIYLWYNQIPANFNARSYADLNKEMEAIRTYSTEPGFSAPVDRWSFAIKQSEWDDISSGVAKDFGLNIFFRAEGDLRVRIVEKASPAGLAGIRRGWRITKINGNTNITTGNATFIVNAVYYSNSVDLTLQKPDGNSVNVTLNAGSYQEHPVMLDTVYNVGANKAGYVVYNSFLGDSSETVNEFNRVFSKFATQGVNDVIIDLRYNGGGYVVFQNEIANYLVSNAGNGGLMMKQEYNDKYSQYNSSINFNKKGSLNLTRLFFIVSNNTASASELLINNLKPYADVYLIGPDRTYGKPVGYFNIPVGDWYIFPVSSRTTNKNGQGNYFDGFALNSTVADGLDKDWGDVDESCLASALKFIGTGAFRAQVSEEPYIIDPRVKSANERISAPAFKGLIDQRKF